MISYQKIFYHQLQESQSWHSVVIMEEYEDSITVHHNCLFSEQWTKRWMTVSSSKLQNKQSEVCLWN